MRLKLDENLGRDARTMFEAAGHEVETVHSQDLSGSSDIKIFEVCCSEKRCLVTLDLDFADPIRFSAREGGGIVILRARGRLSGSLLEQLIQECVRGFETIHFEQDLWIVEPGRIRVHQNDQESK